VEPPEISPEAAAALGKFSELISDSKRRQAFVDDADSALADAGVKHEHLPKEAMETFRGLSYEELTLLADTCGKLMNAGLFLKLRDGGQVCIL
jgi:hypothetical protein